MVRRDDQTQSARGSVIRLSLALPVGLFFSAKSIRAQSCIVTTDVAGGRDDARGLALQLDGKIGVIGEVDTGPGVDFGEVRYNADFTLDIAFDTDGIVTTDINNNDLGESAVIQPDGKIVVGGNDDVGGPGGDDFVVVGYDAEAWTVPSARVASL